VPPSDEEHTVKLFEYRIGRKISLTKVCQWILVSTFETGRLEDPRMNPRVVACTFEPNLIYLITG
jgi:hypothetical protein